MFRGNLLAISFQRVVAVAVVGISFAGALYLSIPQPETGTRLPANALHHVLAVKVVPPVKITEDLALWHQHFSGSTECSWIQELEQVVVCQFASQKEMNRTLNRASFFAEGEHPHRRGTLVRQNDPQLRVSEGETVGQDIQGKELIAFDQKVEISCSKPFSPDTVCLNPWESNFFRQFLRNALAQKPNLILIAFPHRLNDNDDDEESIHGVLSHELLHAQYFRKAEVRKNLSAFWNQVLTATERSHIKKTLAENDYDPRDENLMINEFFAYLLQAEAEKSVLDEWVKGYRTQLLQFLIDHKTPAISLK